MAANLGDGSCTLEEEVELLEAIYIHELTVEGPKHRCVPIGVIKETDEPTLDKDSSVPLMRHDLSDLGSQMQIWIIPRDCTSKGSQCLLLFRPTSFSVLLHPSTGDEEQKRFVCLTLVITVSDEYPSVLPFISIKSPRGLSDAHIESILSNLRELAESRLGGPMLYELIEFARESLTDNNIPSCACAICLCHFQDTHEFTKTECYHYFHCGCLARYIEFSLQQEDKSKHSQQVECPICRLPISYDLEELDKLGSSELNDEEVKYQPTEDMKILQKRMSSMFEKQKRKGGIIDVEQEKNKFLIDITSRQENRAEENIFSSGSQTTFVTLKCTSVVPVYKRGNESNNTVRKEESERSDKRRKDGFTRSSQSPASTSGGIPGELPDGIPRGSHRGITGEPLSDYRGSRSSCNSDSSRHAISRKSGTELSRIAEKTRGFEQNRMRNRVPRNPRRPKTSDGTKSEDSAANISIGKKQNGLVICGDNGVEGVHIAGMKADAELNDKPCTSFTSPGSVKLVCVKEGYASGNVDDGRPRSTIRSRGKGRAKQNKNDSYQRTKNPPKPESKLIEQQTDDTNTSYEPNDSIQETADQGKAYENSKAVRPPPGFSNVTRSKGGFQSGTNAPRPPPGGFDKLASSPKPRPTGLSNQAEEPG